MLQIAEFAERSEKLKQEIRKELELIGAEIPSFDRTENEIRLVFVGQYSAGKSSIVKMLTGRDDIKIGPGITTEETHTYDWNGIEIIDTPGIHTGIRPDHDEISYEAIASADMLVFVITSELFDSNIAEHFRKLAIDKDKAGEMILVVNKMQETMEGNTPEQQEIIREDLKKVVDPYDPDQLHLSFLDAESYLESLADPERAERLLERSGYSSFVEILNEFVREKSLPSKLTTELYMMDESLEKAIKELRPVVADEDMVGFEESLLQQRFALREAKNQIRHELKDIYTTTASRIRNIGQEAANLFAEGNDPEVIKGKLEEYEREIEDIEDQCEKDIQTKLEKSLMDTQSALVNIEESEFSTTLKSRLSDRVDEIPEGAKKLVFKVGPGFENAGKKVLQNAYKKGTAGGLKLTNFSGSKVHDLVIKVGGKLGKKFKPWEAVKLTRQIAVGAQALSVFGVALNIYSQAKEDADEEKRRLAYQNARRFIRSAFNEEAYNLEDYFRQYIETNASAPLDLAISEMDSSIQEIRDTRQDRSLSCKNLEKLKRECNKLIRDIHISCATDAVLDLDPAETSI